MYAQNNLISCFCRHVHLELRRISREFNMMFGLQMTVKMGSYFTFLALSLWEFVCLIFSTNYPTSTTLISSIALTVLLMYMFRLILINYMCERVNIKVSIARSYYERDVSQLNFQRLFNYCIIFIFFHSGETRIYFKYFHFRQTQREIL